MEIAYQLGPAPVRGGTRAPALSSQRALVLEALQRRPAHVTSAQLATELGLHVNTVREHLDALVERGLALRERGVAQGRGRPAWTYTATDAGEPDVRVRDYTALATALSGHIARTSPDPQADATEAGRAWGAELAGQDGRPRPRSAVEARRRVAELLGDLGFDPAGDARMHRVRLRRCPLLDAARRHPEVVCAVHLGITQGAMEALGRDASGADLVPFAEPGACLLTMPTGD